MVGVDCVRNRCLGALHLDQEVGEHRNHRQRHNQRREQGVGDREREGEEELTDQAADHAERQEDRNRRDGRAGDRRGDLACAVEHRFADRLTLAAVPINVFEHHNGVVDDSANRYGKPAEGHDVDGDAGR